MGLSDPKKYEHLLTPAGREGLQVILEKYRKHYGADWLAKFKERNPFYIEVIDLCANGTADEAYEQLQLHVDAWIAEQAGDSKIARMGLEAMAEMFFKGQRPALAELHAMIRTEIDRSAEILGGDFLWRWMKTSKSILARR